jgi:hypothetical protein
MVIPDRVEALTAEDLAPVVRKATDVRDAWPIRWTCSRLVDDLVNPVTVGLFKVEGEAEGGGRSTIPWTSVLKIVRDVSFGDPALEVGYNHEPQDWNYWNRELHVYRSGCLDSLPGPLTAVRCWGCTEVASDESWLWLSTRGGPSSTPMVP